MASEEWNTNDQIRSHKLAASIINGHGADGKNFVFDEENLSLLQRFVADPDASREEILKENDWVDDGEGEKTAKRDGSLVGYLVARHGTEDPALDERDLEMLRAWFARGMPSGQEVVR